jgi:8-oxo-dGTP diphosphatase
VEYDYPKFHLTMHCYFCHIEEGHPVLLEHEAAKWLSKEQLNSVDWLPADQIVIDSIISFNNNVIPLV